MESRSGLSFFSKKDKIQKKEKKKKIEKMDCVVGLQLVDKKFIFTLSGPADEVNDHFHNVLKLIKAYSFDHDFASNNRGNASCFVEINLDTKDKLVEMLFYLETHNLKGIEALSACSKKYFQLTPRNEELEKIFVSLTMKTKQKMRECPQPVPVQEEPKKGLLRK